MQPERCAAEVVAVALVTAERAEHGLPPCPFAALTGRNQQLYLARAEAVLTALAHIPIQRAENDLEAMREVAAKVCSDDADRIRAMYSAGQEKGVVLIACELYADILAQRIRALPTSLPDTGGYSDSRKLT